MLGITTLSCNGRSIRLRLYTSWRAEKLFIEVKLSVPGSCRTEDVKEYFKKRGGKAGRVFKSVLTFQEVVATGRYIQRHLFNGAEARQARCHTGKFPTHGRAPHGALANGPGQSPPIPLRKGVPIGRIATQTRHSGSDTGSGMSVSVCARAQTISLRSSSRAVSVHSRVWRGQAPPGSTHEGHSGRGDEGQWSRLPLGRAEQPCGCDSRPRVTSPVSQNSRHNRTHTAAPTSTTHSTGVQ